MARNRTFRIDSFSKHAVVMGDIHAHIHEGILFEATFMDEAVVDDGVILVRITTAADQPCHMRIVPGAGGDAQFNLFEDTTFSAAGTEIIPTNRNRFVSTTAVTTVRHTPAVDAPGTELLPPAGQFLPGGSGFFATPGSTTPEFGEWILAAGTEYLLQVMNLAGTTQPAGLSLLFYEPPQEV